MALHQGPHGESLVAGRLLGQRRNGRRHRPKPGVRVGRKPPQESAPLEFEEEEMQTTSHLILSNIFLWSMYQHAIGLLNYCITSVA